MVGCVDAWAGVVGCFEGYRRAGVFEMSPHREVLECTGCSYPRLLFGGV